MKHWNKVKLSEVLKHRKGFITIDDNVEYKLCRVQLHRKGIVLREMLYGYQIQTKKQQVCRAGDFLVAEMDAKVGGYGFVPQELDGAIVSSHYFLFELDTNKIRPQYLEVVSQLKVLQEQIKAVGSTNYAAIRPANVLNWEIPLPPIEKQIQIENTYAKCKKIIDKLNNEFSFQLQQLENLNQAILQEAVQGKLVSQDPTDEPASELLKRIKAEKEKSGKKEKPLPPIKPGEIPFEIPESWVWCRLGGICQQITDGEHLTPPKTKTGRMLLSAKNVRDGYFDFENIDFISEEDYQKSIQRCKPEKNDILIVSVGATIGRSAILKENYEFALVRSVALVKPFIKMMSNYIKFIFDSPLLQKEIASRSWGTAQPCLYLNQIKELTIPLPPLSEQTRIVAEIEKQLAKTKQLKEHIIANQQATEQLLKALLHEAFEVKGEEKTNKEEAKVIDLKPTPGKIDYDKRTVLAAEIVWQLHQEPTLGHLKLQKLIYLCQKSANMQLPTNFLRQAMGPYDPEMMRSIDTQFIEKKWFEYHQTETFKYKPLEKAGQHQADFYKYFSAEQSCVQFILDTFKTAKSDVVEIVATLYACLEQIKAEKAILSEGLLLQRFYGWSEEKKKFQETEVLKRYKWMSELGILPT